MTEKVNIFASTIDKADVDVMHDRIKNGANLSVKNVFQFDFLNDDFDDPKVPAKLREIISSPDKRKKLLIYINPPYAEVSSKRETDTGKGKKGVNLSRVRQKYKDKLSTASRELFAQFLIRISEELDGCVIGQFSTLKGLQGSAFDVYRKHFKPALRSLFIVPANTFDNVKGKFPIGFFVWDTKIKEEFKQVEADVFDAKGVFLHKKIIVVNKKNSYINKWISKYKIEESVDCIGYMDGINGNDFQHNNIVYITNNKNAIPNPRGIWIDKTNLIACCVYIAVRKSIPSTWENDRDQFLVPSESWEIDFEFQSNCLAYALCENKIKTSLGKNHWIPFKESEVNASQEFDSHFMFDFINGRLEGSNKLCFSQEAQKVIGDLKAIYSYYHKVTDENSNASFMDIKLHFCGSNKSGKMNAQSNDEEYAKLLKNLNISKKELVNKITPKIYQYKFLI